MKQCLLVSLMAASLAAGCQAESPAPRPSAPSAGLRDGVALSGSSNIVQLRLYTNASAGAGHLFNTFDLEAFGEVLLRSPGRQPLGPLAEETMSHASLHHVLVNGAGPELVPANSMTVIEEASGPEWRYLAWDLSAAYRGRLQQYRRAILFVEPDVFVIYDHLVAPEPASIEMRLHPPAATVLDTNWGDLRLDLPRGSVRIHTPAPKGLLRPWKRIDSAADALLPGTVTMRLGPTNQVSQLDLLTVLVVYPPGGGQGLAFKLLESSSAIGARIHRAALPTLVAFRTDPAAAGASLTGFGFSGPVGVSVFRPKPRSR